MVQFVPLLDAKKLAEKNQKEHGRLMRRKRKAERLAKDAEATLDEAYSEAFDRFLASFATTFAQIKNVELGELPTVTAVPELNGMSIELRAVGLKAVDTLAAIAGGSAAGAATGGLTFAAVGAFATASTGTAIAGLSGAAATSATLAWLGGGSLAAGGMGVAGGTAVLTGLVAAPLLLAVGGFLWWKGNQAYQEQKRVREQLKQAEAQLNVELAKSSTAVARVLDTAGVVRELIAVGEPRLPVFDELVDRDPDYRNYTVQERGRVAELAGLATAVAAVIACPILNEDGTISSLSDETLAAGRSVAQRLAA